MKLKVKILGFQAGGKHIVIIDDDIAEKLDIRSLDRVKIKYMNREIVAIVNVAKFLPGDIIGVYDEVAELLKVREGDVVEVIPAGAPESLLYIRKKLTRARLNAYEAKKIIEDIVNGYISDVELTALVTALHYQGMSLEEALNFTRAMVETGETLKLPSKIVLDKHSLGGVPGDKTSMIVVPIIASLGYIIPKTSSRAITSAAGTADRMEVLAPVSLEIEEMKKVILKTNGCLVWGGALGLAPADDIIIRVEYPLGIDPFFIPSILAKKLAVGSTHVVLDIPTGRGAKVATISEARELAQDFIQLASHLGIKLEAAVTYGEQPIGHAIGPALEAKEALMTLMGNGPSDLIDKATSIAGILLEMVGNRNGREIALHTLQSGKAEKKMREIIEAQGGDPNVKPEDIGIGDKHFTVYAETDGFVFWINNQALALIGKTAGSPKDKGAGVYVYTKLGTKVKKGDPLFTVYAESSVKLHAVEKILEELNPIAIGSGIQAKMLLEKIDTRPEKIITLER